MEVPQGAGAWLGGEPRRVQLQGWCGMLHNIAVKAAQALRDGDVFGVVVLIVGQVERVLLGLETGHMRAAPALPLSGHAPWAFGATHTGVSAWLLVFLEIVNKMSF